MSELLNYKCPNCGGRLEFDSETQKLKCPFCQSEFNVTDFEGAEENTYKYENMEQEDKDLVVYVCNSCGGTIMADHNTIATSCPYCGSPVVMQENVQASLKPDALIPFKLNKEEAISKFRSHLLGRPLLPKAFRDKKHIDEIKGVYVPFWLFDGRAYMDCDIAAERVRHWSDSEYEYTETSFFDVSRSGALEFDDVPVDGSVKLDDRITQSLEVFQSKDLVPYNSGYLAGYYAEKYDISDEEVKEIAYRRVRTTLEDQILFSIDGYDSKRIVSSNMKVSHGKVTYALYPVWLMTTKWKDETYLFAMNGQTGKFVGDLPVDNGLRIKYAILTFIGSLAALFGIVYWIVFKA